MCPESITNLDNAPCGSGAASKRWKSSQRAHCVSMQTMVPLFCAVLIGLLPGCSSLDCLKGIPSVSVTRIPRSFLGRARSEMVQISMARLRQVPPKVYQLGPNDTLGIYIENVLGQPDEAPPVNFPEDGSKPPSIGFPIPIGEDGRVALPLVAPIDLAGLTLAQATDEIRAAYTINNKILPEGKDRIIVTLQRPRMQRIMVIREEGNAAAGAQNLGGVNSPGLTKHGTGETVDLPAYENDLLHALNETGGLPGLDAENEVLIIRGGFQDARQRELLMAQMAACRNPCDCPSPVPDDPNVVRIPIRYYPEQPPSFATEDIILNTGDIVFVQSRDREQFYTGGAISGGAQLIPRDYDIDILQAIAVSGGSFGSGGTGLGRAGNQNSGGGNSSSPIPPSRAIVIRKTCNGQTVAIRVDLRRAITDSNQRLLIQPEDMILVQYTLAEEIANFALRAFQINYLLGSGLKR
jgi:protein involved in polysaccharide export with SLBB domain